MGDVNKELILMAAKQNLERDVRMNLFEGENVKVWKDLSDEDRIIYMNEAKYLLEKYGENYKPDFPDHKLIRT